MSYQCTLFSNTGFNAVNIPDSPALLAVVGNPVTVPALEIVQNRFLNSIRVHAVWNTVKDVDYCLVGDFYYMVEDVRMLNGDTAELILLPDFITSAGGVSQLTFIDGLTERVHVTNDSYGKYNEYDELMAPAEPLRLSKIYITPGAGFRDIIEATVELEESLVLSQDALTYTDGTTGEKVTVPQNPAATANTDFTIAGNSVTGYTALYDGTDAGVKRMVQRVRSLGAESSIISHYKLPTAYGTVATGQQFLGGYGQIDGVDRDNSITLPFQYGTYTPRNLKTLYSSFTKYGLLGMSGNKVEFDPSDIYDGGTSPTVRIVTDPRPEGKPYFRYKTYRGENSLQTFFLNCVAGAPWAQVPLVYTEKSGNELNRLQYEAERQVELKETYQSAFSQIGQSTVQGFSSGLHGGLTGAAIGGVVGTLTGGLSAIQLAREYKDRAQMEAQRYAINNLVRVPEIQFPYEADMLRDTLSNGVVCYRYLYTETDLQRVDKILTMYGYKHTKPIETTDFTNRTDFNYIKTAGAEVTGLPRWWCDGVAAQLSAGVRVWHVAPSPSYY